jgi:uncharacterized protein
VSDNTEIVRRIYASWSALEGTPEELMHPEIVYVNPAEAIEPGTREGQEAFAEAVGRVGDAWSEIDFEIHRLVESGDRVAGAVTMISRGRASGAEVVTHQSHLWTLRDGKALRFEWFTDPESALAAIGEDD